MTTTKTPNKRANPTITVQLPAKMLKQLRSLAGKGVLEPKVSDLVRYAIEDYLSAQAETKRKGDFASS